MSENTQSGAEPGPTPEEQPLPEIKLVEQAIDPDEPGVALGYQIPGAYFDCVTNALAPVMEAWVNKHRVPHKAALMCLQWYTGMVAGSTGIAMDPDGPVKQFGAFVSGHEMGRKEAESRMAQQAVALATLAMAPTDKPQ